MYVGIRNLFRGISNYSKSATSTKRIAKIIIQLKNLEALKEEPLIDGGKSLNSQIRYIIDFGKSTLSSEDLSGYKINLYNKSDIVLQSITSSSDGYFEFDYTKELSYFIISKGNYSNRINIKTSNIKGILNFYLNFV